ncbi:SDR family NAD(P)-dependent oxidoreductase [Ferrimonas pelagia]|uniref:SDR family oxidoreductase n=1 Tax=Ferrimonas pelagia TaxID=1177826 RepID=A0ABP9EEW8_9GAMM
MELEQKVVVITGGAGGLGMAMARQLGAQGARIALLDINAEALAQAVATLGQGDIQAVAYPLDITDEAAVEATFATIGQQLGGVDVLINNAGLLRDGLLLKVKEGEVQSKMSLAQFQSVLDVNLTGAFLCGREAAALMATGGSSGGVIINISSLARAGNMGQTNYSASKAGIVAMTVCWAKELARFGIRTGAIAPGIIATEMTQSMKPEALGRLAQLVPVGRIGAPEEVAHGVEYIIKNDYFNGRVLEIDGGIRL